MNDDQIRIVQETFEKVRSISEAVAELFYKRLFQLNPSFKSLFKGNMKTQGKMFMQMLDLAAKGLDEADTILPTIHSLGKNHVEYDVKEEYYSTVGEALLWTLEQDLGSNFTPKEKEACTEASKLLSDAMMNAAREINKPGEIEHPNKNEHFIHIDRILHRKRIFG